MIDNLTNKHITALIDIGKRLNNLPTRQLDELDPNKTALVIIDMVNGFTKTGLLSSPRAVALIEPIVKLQRKAKERNIPIIAFADTHTKDSTELKAYGEHCLKGTLEAEIVDEIKVVGGYKLIEKNSTNGYLEDKYQAWLKENPNINTFIVVGVCSDICVLEFVLAQKADFDRKNKESTFIVPANMIDTFDSENHNGDLMNMFAQYKLITVGADVVKSIE